MAPRRALPVQYHVRAGEEVYDRAVRYLTFHGFCCIETDAKMTCLRAVKEAQNQAFSFTPEIIIDGLLGEDGSGQTAAVAPGHEVLQELDGLLSSYGKGFAESSSAVDLNLKACQRSPGLLHLAGAVDELPALSEADASTWLPTFLRHHVMLLLFLGPAKGTLELQPFDEDGLPMRVATEPGMLLALRADLLYRRYSCAPGAQSYIMSCFLLGPETSQRTPTAESLDQWMLRRIEVAAQKGDARWNYGLDHMYHQGEQHAVRGAACKLSVNWDPIQFSHSLLNGSDYVVEVPQARWDHTNYYSDDDDCWKRFQVHTRHTCLIDGLDLFDAKFFRIAPAEVRGMDPLQRQILEVGYAALFDAGQTSKSLLQSLTAIYVASPISEWQAVDSGPMEEGGCAQRSAGTGIAGSIMSNRFSFVFGMNGPSITFDTDASSSLVALEHGVLALDERRQQSSQSSITGVTAVLTPLTWLNRVALGHMTRWGRCLTYNTSCDGWLKSENFGSLLVDRLQALEERPYLGSLAAVAVCHSGQAATLGTPHGPVLQKVIVDACRRGELHASSVDAMECHGEGLALNDAIEVRSMCAALETTVDRMPLQNSCVKTNMGNALHAAGMASLLKVLFSQRKGVMKPLQHLRQVHPQTEAVEQNIMLATENLAYYTRSSVHGVLGLGWGGTVGAVVCTGSLAQAETRSSSRSMMLWLGGGGEAPRSEQASVTTRSGQQVAMSSEAPGVLSATVQGGEEFYITLDGSDRYLAPQDGWYQSGSRAHLQSKPPAGCCWRLSGEAEERFRVQLVTSGKWQVVTWRMEADGT